MGSGSWDRDSFARYTTVTKKMSMSEDGAIDSRYSHQEIFASRHLAPELDPKNTIRECCDSDEHKNTFPVILALDVTGSMGPASAEVAKKLNVVMTQLYDKVPDIEFMIMAIGDTAYDDAPIQASQFESDIRIAQQLDKVYFEAGGGGNDFESYTAAWYFGTYHCKLDCWKRGRKGLIITMGDERCNPCLSPSEIERFLGKVGPEQILNARSIETPDLYKVTSEKYDLYHIHVDHKEYYGMTDYVVNSYRNVIGNDHALISTVNEISDTIVDIIMKKYNSEQSSDSVESFVQQSPVVGNDEEENSRDENQEIGW